MDALSNAHEVKHPDGSTSIETPVRKLIRKMPGDFDIIVYLLL